MRKKKAIGCCALALCLSAVAATLHRNAVMDVSGTDYGLMPANTPSVGDIMIVTKNGTAWANLTNIVSGIITNKTAAPPQK